jgi:two-component system, NarL family, nitrate/nitrite response regulator NarL
MGQNGATPDLGSSGATAADQEKPRIILADDHPELLAAIGRRLAPNFNVLCSVAEGFSLIRAASELRPDAVISDINMPHLTGIEACRQILQQGFTKHAIVLSVYDDRELVRSALEAGIRGYVLKIDAAEELISAVEMVLAGQTYLSRRVLQKWTP